MTTHGVTVRNIRVLRGPNLYAYMPVLQVIVDIGEYETRPSNTFPGFVDRLTAWLPGLQKHECSHKRPGGFIERVNRGTDRKSTRLNSSHGYISYAVFCLKKKKKIETLVR